MLDGVYKNYLSGVALQRLTKSADIPDIHLCIGDAERLEHIPLLNFKTVTAKQKTPEVDSWVKVPYEKTGRVGEYIPIGNGDFCKEFDLGTPLKGVV